MANMKNTPNTAKTPNTDNLAKPMNAAGTTGTAGPSSSAAPTRPSDPRVTGLVAARDVKALATASQMVDVRGWDVVTADGATFGKVDAIMLDLAKQLPRYLAVDTKDKAGTTLLPIGVGAIERGQKQVALKDVSPATLRALPAVTDGAYTPEVEQKVFRAFSGKSATQIVGSLYTDPIFDMQRLFGTTHEQRPTA